jgi:1,2-diacylglycerol 3-beta-galactosyltransferase
VGKPKKILVLTADAGFGHRSAALAIKAALEVNYGGDCQVEIVNPLEDKRTPFFLRDSQTDYDRIVRNSPELYRLGYGATDAPIPTVIMESTLTILLFEVLRDLIFQVRPDVIVSTYPFYQAPLDAIFKVYRDVIPLFTVITDLVDVHRIWFSNAVTGCMAPTVQVKNQAIASGLPAEKVHITGIPVHPNVIRDDRPKEVIRTELGWRSDLPTVLVVGSRRVERISETLEVLNHFGRPLQLAVVAGKDDALFEELQKIEWHQPVHLYRFVENMPVLMRAADAIVCKAGGLIVTESLACGLPMILIDIIPGQEMGNAEYVLKGGAGDLARSQMDTLYTLAHWFSNDGEILKERSRAANLLGNPNSAYQVAELLWQTAQKGSPGRKRRIVGRPLLIEFLAKNKIDLSETIFSRKK